MGGALRKPNIFFIILIKNERCPVKSVIMNTLNKRGRKNDL